MAATSTSTAEATGRSHAGFSLSDRAKFAIKLGLAMAIAFGIALRSDWMSPTWAATAVAMIGQVGHGQSLYKGMLRGVGTILAFFSGLLILSLFPQDRWMLLVATSPFLGYFAYRMKGENDYLWFVAAFVTPMIVMAGPTQPGHAFEFAAYRTVETLMGIGVWALVSVFLWPVTNLGALRSATDKMLAVQQEVLAALREAATNHDSTGVPLALQEEESTLIVQAGALIDVVAAETYEVRGVRDAWHRLNAANMAFSQLLSRIQSEISDFKRIPLSSVVSGIPELLTEMDARLAEVRSMLDGAPPARPPRHVTLEVDVKALEKLGHLERAAVAAARAELNDLDAETRLMVERAREISDHAPTASSDVCKTAQTEIRGPFGMRPVDRDQAKAGLIAVTSMWVGALIWFYIDPPGHASWFQFVPNLTLLALRTPHARFFPLRVFAAAYLIGMVVYVFIMPHLSGFAELGFLIFAFTFVAAYYVPKMTTFLMLAMLNMFGITNEQSYDFASMMNTYVFTMTAILVVYGLTFLIGSPRPEKTMLRQIQRFFRSSQLLVSGVGAPESLVGKMREAYHHRQVRTLPDTIATWGAQIDHARFPQNSPDQVKGLAAKLQLLSFRIDDLLGLRGRCQSDLFTRELRDDVAEWQTLVDEAFEEWSKVPETDPDPEQQERLSGRRAQLDARFEENVSRLQTSDAKRQDFYRILGAFRSVTVAAMGYGDHAKDIDWAEWREERFQ